MDKTNIVGLIDGMKTGLTVHGLTNRPEIAQVVISSESMDEGTAATAKSSLESLNEIVQNTIDTVISAEGMSDFDPTAAQLKAAQLVAGLAMDPTAARQNLNNLKAVTAQNVVGTVDAMALGVEDIMDTENISVESFDGQTINSAVYFSVVYNLLASKQDAFGELFFPTVTIDPTSSGASIEARVINLYDEVTRGTNGASDRGKFNKKSIVKAIVDPTILSVDKNLLVPVLREENAAVLAADLKTVNTEKGEKITTAPLKMGKAISVLGVSQTDAQLAKGVMDNTDALDRRVQVQDVFFDLTGKNGDGDEVTETFKFNIAMLPHSNFTYSTQDHNKDLMLSFTTDGMILNTAATKQWNGAGSEILAQLAQNYTVRVELVLHGDGNTQIGDVAVYSSSVKLVEVLDAGGNILDEADDNYKAIAAVIETCKPRAYSVEAYTTNSNIRQRGQLVGVDIHNQIYTVPVRSGVTILKTVGNSNDTDNDATYLASQVAFTGIKMSLEAVNTLVSFSETLRQITSNGNVKDAAILGVSRFFVDAYYNETNLNIANNIDSVRSGEKMEDIKGTLTGKIKDEVIKMFIESNYAIASKVLNGGVAGKTSVLIGTDSRTAQYLTNGTGKIEIGDEFEVHLATTQNPLVKGKMFISFGDTSASKNEKVNPLGFGVCFWSPEVSLDVVANRGGSIVRELSTLPRFLHVPQLPILTVINISGIEESLGKVTKNFATV